ncbi:MAG: two-component regulator propeller domain-containing protein [Flavihumibacter sp.]
MQQRGIYILFFLINFISTQGQKKTSIINPFPYTFQTWDIHNGLLSNFCYKVAGDENGYIYVATNTGLFSFNGNYFSSMPPATGRKSISTGNTEDIIIDNKNRIWIASTDFGLGLLDLKQATAGLQFFNPPKKWLSPLNTSFQVSKLCFDKNGHLWVGTRGNGLFRFDTANRVFSPVAVNNTASPFNHHVRHLSVYDNNTLFVGLINGLSVIDLTTNQMKHIAFRREATGEPLIPTVRQIIHWRSDTFAIATDRGAYWLNLSNGLLSNISPGSNTISFAAVNCNDIYRISDQELWFATENDGVLFYRPAGGEISYSYLLSIYDKGIPKCFVNSFFKDAKNNLWIAHSNGLSIFRLAGIQFNTYSYEEKSNPFGGTLIPGKYGVVCVKNDRMAEIGPFNKIAVNEKPLPFKNPPNAPSCVVQKGENSYLVFSRYNFTLINTSTNQSRQFKIEKSNIHENTFRHFRVMQCIIDTIGNREAWLLKVNTDKGSVLLFYYPDEAELVYLPAGKFADSSNRFHYTKIIKTGRGKYWAATRNTGLLYLDVENPAKNILYNSHFPNAADDITDMTAGDGNSLWLLFYNKGLCYFNYADPSRPAFTVFGQKNGLSDLHLHNLVKDGYNNIWITSNNGLYCFETTQKKFYNFSAYSGFNTLTPHINDIDMICPDGKHVFISDRFNNFVWFNTQKNYDSLSSVSLVLKSIVVNDSSIQVNNQPDGLQFRPDENDVSFQYDVLDYSRISYYEIMYRLDGFDKEWKTSANSGAEVYRQLPGGKYTFSIKLRYADNTTTPEISLPFTVATIWYKSSWFLLLCVLMTAAAIYFMNRLYIIRKLARQKAVFEKQYAIEQERSRISAELHDDLGGGLSTIRILSEIKRIENPNNDKGLLKISEHSKDLMQKMNEIVWALNIKNDTLENLISYLRQLTVSMLEEVNLNYQFNAPEEIPFVKVDGITRRHIQLLVKEALHNIIKHADAGNVAIDISVSGSFSIRIHDNGKGIGDIQHYPVGRNGLSNMNKHAVAVKGSLSIKTGQGTTVSFSVMLKYLSHESVS